jgi:hypothetical protein
MAEPAVRSLPPKECDLAVALSGCGKQRGRGGKVVLLGKGLRPHAEISYGREVHAARVLHDVVEPLGRFHVQRWISVAPGRSGRSGAWARERCQQPCAAGSERFAPGPRCRSHHEPPVDRYDQPEHGAVVVHPPPATATSVGEL